jgi:type III pantothenate kinase
LILCDIGNTNAHILRDGELKIESLEKFLSAAIGGEVYYICVNDSLRSTLNKRENFIDLESFIKFDTPYKGIGIDRICACKSVYDGVVVDAGSAITVDVMSGGKHQGGFILPGLKAYEKAYALISPRLDFAVKREVLLNVLPKNTKDAVSFAVLKSLILTIQDSIGSKDIYFTGGDGEYLSSFFKNGIFDKMLVFKTLLNTVEELKKGKFKC